MADNDRTFNLGLTITAPPDRPQGQGAISPVAPTGEPVKETRKSRRQRKKSSKSESQAPASPDELTVGDQAPKSVGFLRRLFSRRDKSRGKTRTAPSSPTEQVSKHHPTRQLSGPLPLVSSAAAHDAPCPSPRLASRLRPSASADALSSMAGGGGGPRTTAEVTPGATTSSAAAGLNDSVAAENHGQPHLLTPQDVLGGGQKSMQRSRSEGMMPPSPAPRRVGPHAVTLKVKAITNVREKNIDPSTGVRTVVVNGNGQRDFGMALAGINPVLVMKVDQGGPAEAAGLKVNDMIVSVSNRNTVRCAHAEIMSSMMKASHTEPHVRSQTEDPQMVQKVPNGGSPSAEDGVQCSPRPSVTKNPAGNQALFAELKDNLQRSPRPSLAKARHANGDALPTVHVDSVDSPGSAGKPASGHDAIDGGDEDEDEVMKRLEEAADLIMDVVLSDKPEKPEKPKLSGNRRESTNSQNELMPPSQWDASGKPPGSAPSSPGTSRRETKKEMSFEELAAFSKSAPTTPGAQRKAKLKRSSSSKGSAFIVEHKSGRMVSVAARRTILSGSSSGADIHDRDAEDERKKVQLIDDFEASVEETLDLEAALGKANAKLGARTLSTSESDTAAASPEVVVTPPRVHSPKPSVTEAPPPMKKPSAAAQKDARIAGLQQALMASPGKLSGGYHQGGGAPTTPQSPEPSEQPTSGATSPRKPSLEGPSAAPRKASTEHHQRSKSVKVFTRKSSTSDFDALMPTAGPSLGLQAGHAKRDIARGRSVRKPSRPRSVHRMEDEMGTADLFVADTPAASSGNHKPGEEEGPKRKQGVWDTTLSPVQPPADSERKSSTLTPGVNLIVQTRLDNGSPGGSPMRRSKRLSSAAIILQATQSSGDSSPVKGSSSPVKASNSPVKTRYRRTQSAPLLDDASPETADEDPPHQATAAAACAGAGANGTTSVAKPAGGGVVKRRAKTVGAPVKQLGLSESPSLSHPKLLQPQWVAVARGRAERLKSQPDEPPVPPPTTTTDATIAKAYPGTGPKPARTKKPSLETASKAPAPDLVAPAAATDATVVKTNPGLGIRVGRTKKPSLETAPKASAPDWVAMAKAKQRVA